MTPDQSRRPLFLTASSAASLATTKLRAASNAYAPNGILLSAADDAQDYLAEAVAALGAATGQDPELYLAAITDQARIRITELTRTATSTEEPA